MVFCCCGCVPKPCSLCLAGSLAARCGKHAKKNWKVSALFSSSRVSEGTLGTFWGFRCYVLGHEIRWCFAVADASQSHAACAWQARWSSNFSKCAKPTEICRKKHMNKKHVHSQSMFIWIWNDVDMYLNSPLHSTAFFGLNKCIPRTPRHQFSTAKPSFALEVPGFAHGAKGFDQNPRSQAFGRGILWIQPGCKWCMYLNLYAYVDIYIYAYVYIYIHNYTYVRVYI